MTLRGARISQLWLLFFLSHRPGGGVPQHQPLPQVSHPSGIMDLSRTELQPSRAGMDFGNHEGVGMGAKRCHTLRQVP